ncbi:Ral guanine nucleotide dissociation stimulator [Galemys pyrenaicus]|uniref:Ral guanine nucleotide dissociation stimulator n=1 Tax=Galemys pyrenaicus TaxID=202257 RepID=A0A8J6DYF4_GALPY|nr:Ral guanine nucleotide dissociation stimulator [Galemys pyrenaicus]
MEKQQPSGRSGPEKQQPQGTTPAEEEEGPKEKRTSTQEIIDEMVDGFKYSDSLDKWQKCHTTDNVRCWPEGMEEELMYDCYSSSLGPGQVHQATNNIQCCSGWRETDSTLTQHEACTMQALTSGRMEKLRQYVVIAFPDRNIPCITTFLFSDQAFNSTQYFLDQMWGRELPTPSVGQCALTHIWNSWTEQYLKMTPPCPSFKITVAFGHNIVLGSDQNLPAPQMLVQLEILNSTESEPEELEPALLTAPTPEPTCPWLRSRTNLQRKEKCDIKTFPPRLVAQQLTLMDAELFKEVVPHDCLGSTWSRRNKPGNEHLSPTVRATISQFNLVASCVITTCLGDLSMTAQDRARVVEHWIKVASVCCDTPSDMLTAWASSPP